MGAVQLPVQRAGKRCVRNENEVVSLDVVIESRKGLRLLNWHSTILLGLADKLMPTIRTTTSLFSRT
jgi:hypothetical protein